MLHATVRYARVRAVRPIAAPYATLALAGFAVANVLLYWYFFTRPYNLLNLHDRPLLDFHRLSKTDPDITWQLLQVFFILGVFYWLAWRAAQQVPGQIDSQEQNGHQSRAAWAIVIGGTVASSSVLLFMYPIGAADIFDNIVHGRILGIYWHNPFYVVAEQFPDDPFYAYMAWPKSPSAYGPLWELMAGGAARLAGDGIVANVLLFKLVGALFLAGTGSMVYAVLRRKAPQRTLAGVVLLAWNPAILYHTLGNGHNDIVMVFWILAAVWLLVIQRNALAILALLVGALVKFIPLLLLPAAGLIALRDLPNWQVRIRFVLLTGLAGALLVILSYALFWQDLTVLSMGRRAYLLTTSLPALIYYNWARPVLGAGWGAMWVSGIAIVLTAIFAIWQGIRAWRDTSWLGFTHSAFNTLMFYLLLTCLWLQPWYALWPLALAAILPPGHAARLAALFGYVILTKPLLFEPMWLYIRPMPSHAFRELRMGPAVLFLPWLYTLLAFWDLFRRRKNRDKVNL
jgi:hypothetical protein